MVKDAELHSEEDKKQKELIESRNESDTLIYSIEKMIRENEAKLEAGEKDKINSSISRLRTAMEGSSIESIRQAKSELETASHQFAQRIYQEASQQQQQQQGANQHQEGAQGGGESSGKDKVYDADYEVVDDDK